FARKPTDAESYRGKTTTELKADFDDFAVKETANLTGELGQIYKDLVAAGKSFIFYTEDNRRGYDACLKHKTALNDMFSAMEAHSRQQKLDPRLAESFIKEISGIFDCGYETAVAIYNKKANLQGAYIPKSIHFQVQCDYCRKWITDFANEAEAREKKCPYCGRALYRKCVRCNKQVLVSGGKCPECGLDFPDAAKFAKYTADAEQALRRSDFEAAYSALNEARRYADPGEKGRTDELAARISSEERAGAALSRARKRFADAGKLSSYGKADECVAILRDCPGFEPAVNFLLSTPPEACKGISVGADSLACVANIGWTPSSEQGVGYRLVRKQGKTIPSGKIDGETLVDNTKDTTYRDKTILPGQWYGYAVFAVRQGVFSSGRGETLLLLADVTDVRAEQVNKSIRLTWDAPKNSAGITIRRIRGGKETVLTCEAHGSFKDTDVEYGVAHTYRLCANYAGLSPSRGVDIVITPMHKIESFTISAKKIKENAENAYNVSWDINRRGIDLCVLVDGKKVRKLKSDAGNCELELPVNGFHTITVLAYSGDDNWLPSKNSVEVNTYSPCSIDKALSSLHEEMIAGLRESAYNVELHLKIGGVIPKDIAGFYYAVRTNADLNRWPSAQDIGTAHDIQRLSLAAYRKNGEILHRETAREETSYYVSLFTIYNFAGKEIVSEPKRCRFDRQLKAEVFWKVSKSFLGSLNLAIEICGNRPLSQAPRLVLCACAGDWYLLSHKDPKAMQLLTIPAVEMENPRKTYNMSYELKLDLSARQLKNTKFFLFESDPAPDEEFTLHWAKGFTGKI
ncbi:MAG: hypothetical protein LBF80_03560, partial [Spirochaetaceae bacterium]|nr:hypothetical protein [Spirochaetaceae bacterium]